MKFTYVNFLLLLSDIILREREGQMMFLAVLVKPGTSWNLSFSSKR